MATMECMDLPCVMYTYLLKFSTVWQVIFEGQYYRVSQQMSDFMELFSMVAVCTLGWLKYLWVLFSCTGFKPRSPRNIAS